MSCSIYIACRMTGRDKAEMVKRAEYVCSVLKKYGLTPISPVLEENVKPKKGKLVNTNRGRLKLFWKRDKEIIRKEAHVVLVDGAHDKSFGVEREYGLNRWNLWKPTVLVMPYKGLTVADFEDDYCTDDIESAAEIIQEKFGTRWKRWKWRSRMLNRCVPAWLWNQILAWR